MAHDRDMKFNDFVEEVLKEALADFERNPEKLKERVQFTRPSVPHGY